MTSSTVLVAAEAFDGGLDATKAARAIGRGLRAGDGELETDLCPIATAAAGLTGDVLADPTRDTPADPTKNTPADLPRDFDRRMRAARAVVIAAAHLDHETLLRRETVCEIATRARQAGVPCYAVAGRGRLDLFEARILDLQVLLRAGNERELKSAGRKLAAMV